MSILMFVIGYVVAVLLPVPFISRFVLDMWRQVSQRLTAVANSPATDLPTSSLPVSDPSVAASPLANATTRNF